MSGIVEASDAQGAAAQATAPKSTKEQNQVVRAAKNGDTDTIRALIASDLMLVGARDADGSVLLHCAAWKGHFKRGLTLTPLAETRVHDAKAVARLLKEHGATE
ncbi:MAG: ankyrin repeat domain-containing protein [Cytophagales bacterium]|nr:ankyrin repeat domain-containing protein [Armatimonadota bacterium]